MRLIIINLSLQIDILKLNEDFLPNLKNSNE